MQTHVMEMQTELSVMLDTSVRNVATLEQLTKAN